MDIIHIILLPCSLLPAGRNGGTFQEEVALYQET